MNLYKLVFGVAFALVAAVAAGLLVGHIGFWVVVAFLLLIALSWFADRFVYIRVGEMETAVVFNRETRAFSRFLPSGRHLLKFPLERVAAVVSTAPTTVNGRCKNAQTQEGVSVDLEFCVTYELFPDQAEVVLKPKVARFLPSGATGLVRNHASNCVAQVVNRKSVETLCQKGARSHVERDLRETMHERLLPFGIRVHRVMVTSVELPRSVQKALEEAHEHRVYAESEACGLERLHQALNQFSDVDVERLLQLRQLRELGQNGVALYMPYLGNMGNRGNQGDGLAGNGRSPQDNQSFSADRPGSRVNGKAYG